MFQYIHNSLMTLNDSRFFSGLVMIMLNIGSKYVTIELSDTQEAYLRNSIGRQILIFSISWMGTRDIYMALALTAIFTVLTQYLFNEKSSLCILPESVIQLQEVIDINKDNKVSQGEIQHALEVLERANKQQKRVDRLAQLNLFK